jgi:hypothetical protein
VLDPLYIQPYCYKTETVDGRQFIWPATMKPTSATTGGKRLSIQQAPKSTTAWADGDGVTILVPVVLQGDVEFDSEYSANEYVANALEHINGIVRLKRLNKVGGIIPLTSSLVPYFNGRRGNILELSLTLMPSEFPKIGQRQVYW